MNQPPTPDSDRRDPLGFDEVLALLLAFSAVGTVLWWGIGRRAESWISQQALFRRAPEAVSSAASPATSPAVSPVVSPAVEAVPPGVALGEVSPELRAGESSSAVVPSAVIAGAVAPAIVAAPAGSVSASPAVTPSAASPPAAPPTAPIIVPSPTVEAKAFSDVPESYWAAPFISALSQRGIISGFNDGSFRPDEPVNRAQYAALLSGVLTNGQQQKILFSDVSGNFWGSAAIDEAVQSSFLRGYPDQTFKPDQPMSKLQVLLSLARGFDLPRPADPDQTLRALENRDQVPDWAEPAVAAAAQSSVVVSYPNVKQFQPNQPVTRAEVTAMLYQALKTKGTLPPIQSEYILQP